MIFALASDATGGRLNQSFRGQAGSTHRMPSPDAVRYMSVHSRKQPGSDGHSGASSG
jgi:hypothetical protein